MRTNSADDNHYNIKHFYRTSREIFKINAPTFLNFIKLDIYLSCPTLPKVELMILNLMLSYKTVSNCFKKLHRLKTTLITQSKQNICPFSELNFQVENFH
jgi:hypothetical protein